MDIFNWINSIFKPAADLIDELHFSGEEKGNIEVKKQELKNKLAEMEFLFSTKAVELQTKAMEAQSQMAIAEQQHGNWLSKSWRPVASLAMVILLMLMGLGFVEYKELIAQIAGGFLGIYGIGRSYEKGKKQN